MELSKKKYLDVSKDSNQKNTPFRKGHLPYQDRPQGGGDTITRRNQVIKTKTKMFDFKTTRV